MSIAFLVFSLKIVVYGELLTAFIRRYPPMWALKRVSGISNLNQFHNKKVIRKKSSRNLSKDSIKIDFPKSKNAISARSVHLQDDFEVNEDAGCWTFM